MFQVMRGDALDLLPSLPENSVDFIYADPPYFLSNDGFTVKSGRMAPVNKGDWDRSRGFDADVEFHREWITQSLRLLQANGTIAISGTYHSIFKCGFILQALGARIINDLVWFKPNGAPALAGRNFTASHETVIWASKSPTSRHTFNYELSRAWEYPTDTLKRPGKQMRSVWRIPATPSSEKQQGGHPTQKPLELLRRLVALCTNPGDLVLDPFCGSGTTGVAAVELNRRFIGIESEARFVALANLRMQSADEATRLV